MTTTDDRIVTAAVRLFVEKGTTQVTISELAQEANVARGTLYRNVGSMDDLFDRVVGEITADLHRRVSASFGAIGDSAARLATGIRMWVRYAHENPQLGRFAVKFGLSEETLRTWMAGPPSSDGVPMTVRGHAFANARRGLRASPTPLLTPRPRVTLRQLPISAIVPFWP